MKKITKNNTLRKKSTKSVTSAIKTFEEEYYRDMFSFTTKKITEDYLMKLALEWVEVSMKDTDMLCLEEYMILKGISKMAMYRWIKRCTQLQEAHDHVKTILGCRREKGAAKKELDSSFIAKSMAIYNTDWKEIEEWRANMSAKIAGAGGGFHVVEVQKFEDSPLVPVKKV